MRNFSKDDLLDIDFKAYLASSSDEDSARASEESGDEEEDKKIAKYKVKRVWRSSNWIFECDKIHFDPSIIEYFCQKSSSCIHLHSRFLGDSC